MTNYNSWHVGMKVVCVAGADAIASGRSKTGANYPHANAIYTIREIRDDAPWGGTAIVVLLNEVDNSHMIGVSRMGKFAHVEPGFHVQGFRPLEARKTDISVFTKLLAPQPRIEVPSPSVTSDTDVPA